MQKRHDEPLGEAQVSKLLYHIREVDTVETAIGGSEVVSHIVDKRLFEVILD